MRPCNAKVIQQPDHIVGKISKIQRSLIIV